MTNINIHFFKQIMTPAGITYIFYDRKIKWPSFHSIEKGLFPPQEYRFLKSWITATNVE